MKLRSDINARTAMVYGGAAFLLVIVGFRSILATLDPDHVGIMTYLFLREVPTMKTIISLLLALAIILIQVTNVIGE